MADQRRYVVLRHEGIAQPHFDFMCENEAGSLLTLRFLNWPPGKGEFFERLGDHRRAYLEYEGPVSDNRGVVHRVAQGFCTVEDQHLIRLDSGFVIELG